MRADAPTAEPHAHPHPHPHPQAAPADPGPGRRTVRAQAPARPGPLAALHTTSALTAVLLGLVAIGAMIHEPVLIPPLAASAALVHSVPTLPLAQPRSVIVGHFLGAVTGYGVLAVAGSCAWAAAVAAGVTLAVLMTARTPHSPAVATSVIVVLQHPEPTRFVPLLLGATVLLVGAGCAASRVRPKAPKYPAYWW
ncbi:HPP family protein [Streptomyces sp. NPDC002138]|uniref:HPP family protein n=1 Tax=Streptomyces sp. NPDC002138 TaxID=3154410 RepID=UPI00331DED8B